jgi:hypothetical protein
VSYARSLLLPIASTYIRGTLALWHFARLCRVANVGANLPPLYVALVVDHCAVTYRLKPGPVRRVISGRGEHLFSEWCAPVPFALDPAVADDPANWRPHLPTVADWRELASSYAGALIRIGNQATSKTAGLN